VTFKALLDTTLCHILLFHKPTCRLWVLYVSHYKTKVEFVSQ